jgi:hypothetical protein
LKGDDTDMAMSVFCTGNPEKLEKEQSKQAVEVKN